MPFILAAGPEIVGAAILLLLFCWAVVNLINAIASTLPRIAFLFVHLDFGAIFRHIAQPVVWFFTSLANSVWSQVTPWLHAFAYLFVGLWSDVIGLFRHHAAQIDHLHNAVIPQAAGHAAGQAAAHTDAQIAELRHEASLAWAKWDHAHTRTDAHRYIAAAAHAPTVETQLLALAAQALLAGESYTDAQGRAFREYADKLRKQAEGYADHRVGQLGHGIGLDIGGLSGEIGAIGLLGGATLVQSIVGVRSAVEAITNEYESCAVRTCAGPNNFANLLKDALGFASAAELIAFVAKVVENPAAAMAQVEGYVVGAEHLITAGGGGVIGEIDSLLGL